MPAGILPGKAAGGRFANAVDGHENHAGCIFSVLIGISVGNVRQPRSRCSSCPAGATTAGLWPVVIKCAIRDF